LRKGLSAPGPAEDLEGSGFSPVALTARTVMAATGNAGGTTVGDDSGAGRNGCVSSRLGGRTIRARSARFALRRKTELRGGRIGEDGGTTSGMRVEAAAGLRRKGDSFPSGFGVPVAMEGSGVADGTTGSVFFASTGREVAWGWKVGHGEAAAGEVVAADARGPGDGGLEFEGLGSDFIGVDSGGVAAGVWAGSGSGASRLSRRTLPVWLSVRTGSASAINCSIFFIGAAGSAGTVELAGGPATTRVGGRRTTPCMAGRVRVLVSVDPILTWGVVEEVCGPSAAGTGLMVGGCGWPGTGFGLSGAGLKGGGSSDSGRFFLALKKISGQAMVVISCAQFQGI